MSKKPTVLKSFSQLKTDKRIELVAMRIYQTVFRGDAEKAFEPRHKTLVHEVWRIKKLTIRQQQGWKMFRDDIDNAVGKSGASAAYGDYHDKGERVYLPRAYESDAYGRVRDLYERFLGRREKALLLDLLQNDMQEGNELKLEFIGLLRTGYAGKESAYIAGVVTIQALLDRLADFYGY